MADDIVACSELRRQLSRCLEPVLDHVVGDPDTRADDGFLRELGPAERAGG